MSISKTKRNYLWQVTFIALLLGGAGGWGYFLLFPHHYFGGYPFIPVFFWTFGVFTIHMVEACRRLVPKRLLEVYMLLRVMRVVLALMVMLCYGVVVRIEVRAFLLTFIAHYLIFLIYDSWFFFKFEMNRKNRLSRHLKK